MSRHFGIGRAMCGCESRMNIGTDPWLMRKLEGEVRFKRSDAPDLKVTPLDPSGMLLQGTGNAGRIVLRADASYSLIYPG